MTIWDCFLPWKHDWSEWKTVSEGYHIARTDALGLPVDPKAPPVLLGSFETQRRECKRCKKSQLRKVRA